MGSDQRADHELECHRFVRRRDKVGCSGQWYATKSNLYVHECGPYLDANQRSVVLLVIGHVVGGWKKVSRDGLPRLPNVSNLYLNEFRSNLDAALQQLLG